jgi:hypothetical protein
MLEDRIEGPRVSEQQGESMLSDADSQSRPHGRNNAAALSELEWAHTNVSARFLLSHFGIFSFFETLTRTNRRYKVWSCIYRPR